MAMQANGTARFVLKYSSSVISRAVNVLHFTYTNLNPVAPLTLRNLFNGWLGNQFDLVQLITALADGANVDGADVYYYDEDEARFNPCGSYVLDLPGQRVSDQLPSGVAGLINWYTANPRVQGKTYIPYLCEDEMADFGIWSNLGISELEDIADIFFAGTSSTAGTLDLAVWSKVNARSFPVTSYQVNGIPAYQRRRKPGVGY